MGGFPWPLAPNTKVLSRLVCLLVAHRPLAKAGRAAAYSKRQELSEATGTCVRQVKIVKTRALHRLVLEACICEAPYGW